MAKSPAPASCSEHGVMTSLGDKWTILVILQLARAPEPRQRFSRLRRDVAGISQRMLTVTLRMLERHGLVVRHYHAEVPPRVEYELSPMGASLVPALETFAAWIATHWDAMMQARDDYDVQEP
ncbi:winged helix-turn-helix transcriptional regulator [Gluconacetobacter sacchari]|uniref:winged helix-turn-helix transcriptional regulator n=1 Tax=Gluconacetobacter sacchari TaxID=92759 RepID=UPI0039B433E0